MIYPGGTIGDAVLIRLKARVRILLFFSSQYESNKRNDTNSNNMSNMSTMARLPLIRSLADIGRNHSSAKSE